MVVRTVTGVKIMPSLRSVGLQPVAITIPASISTAFGLVESTSLRALIRPSLSDFAHTDFCIAVYQLGCCFSMEMAKPGETAALLGRKDVGKPWRLIEIRHQASN
jgi:hypothetical protein